MGSVTYKSEETMTKEFEKAKEETIQKCGRVLEAVRLATEEKLGRCGFCLVYGKNHCGSCPVYNLCGGELHSKVDILLRELEEKIIEGLSLLEKVEEKVRA